MYQKKAVCTIGLISVNVAVFLWLSFFGITEDAEFMAEHGAMYVPLMISQGSYYRLVTSMFLHFGISHLTNNMLTLGLLGWQLELEVGPLKYLLIYFGSGIGGNLLSLLLDLQLHDYAVSAGASGAIFGIIGALLYIAVRNHGRIGSLSGRGIVFMILLSLYYGFTSNGIDNAAHIGGLCAGFLLGILLYRKRHRKRRTPALG